MNLRVVVNATYWSGNLLGHSISRCAIATAKALSALPDLHVILPVPTDRTKWFYDEADLEGIDEVLPVEYAGKYMTHFATEDWWRHFNVGSGDVYYDAIVEFNPKMVLQMQNWAMVGNYTTKFFLPASPTITTVARPAAFLYELGGRLPSRLLEALALATSPTMFLTQHQRNEAIAEARQFVAGAKLRDIEKRTTVIPHSIDVSRIRYMPRKSPDKVRLMFGTTLSADKQGNEMGIMYDKLLKLGKPVEFVVSLPFRKVVPEMSGQAALAVENLKDRAHATFGESIELHISPPREEFEALLEGADVFLCMTTEESFGISFFEQLQAGQVGIYLRKPWMKGVVPDEYPFVCDTKEEVFARLLWVVDNLEEAQRRVAFMQEWIPTHLSSHVVAKRMQAFLQEQVAISLEHDREAMHEQWLYKCLESSLRRDAYTFEDVARIVKEEKKTNIFAGSTLYSHSVRRMLQLLGFEDALNKDGLPRFKRGQS